MSTNKNYSTETLETALVLGTSTLYEASGISNCAVDSDIRKVWEGAAVAGPAFPVECAPGDNLAIQVALEVAPRGSVLVISTSDFIAGYWGEVLTVAAEAAGIAGLVINGGVRDIAALRTRRFPVFSRGISVKGTLKASVPSVGEPISFSGIPVAPGDLVVADDDGVIILPAQSVFETMRKGQERADKEDIWMEELKQGRTSLDIMGLSQWSQAK